MKGLAWYSIIFLVLGIVAMIAGIADGTAEETGMVAGDIYGIALTIPTVVFFILYLRKE